MIRRRKIKQKNMTLQQEYDLASKISYHLSVVYPGNMWMVNVDGGVAEIKNCFLSGVMGFTVQVSAIDKNLMIITMAGGEILERYNVSREKTLKIEELVDKPKDMRGQLIHER